MKSYTDVIRELNLVPLPKEGGFYRETYRSKRLIESEVLGKKTESTCIYYLITDTSFSALHLVDQDEIFHFYCGSPVEMLQIESNGNNRKIIIGNNIFEGESPQVLAPHGLWQGTKLLNPKPGDWALLGCTVAPGFELQNFHILPRHELMKMYPQIQKEIIEFTNP